MNENINAKIKAKKYFTGYILTMVELKRTSLISENQEIPYYTNIKRYIN